MEYKRHVLTLFFKYQNKCKLLCGVLLLRGSGEQGADTRHINAVEDLCSMVSTGV